MSEKNNSNSNRGNNKSQIRQGHQIGDHVVPKAWQPTKDETTTPPKGNGTK